MLPKLDIAPKDNENMQTLKSILDKGIDDLEAGRTLPADEALARFRENMKKKILK